MNTWYCRIPGFPEFPVVYENYCKLQRFHGFYAQTVLWLFHSSGTMITNSSEPCLSTCWLDWNTTRTRSKFSPAQNKERVFWLFLALILNQFCISYRMREALTYLTHAYEINATLLKKGEKFAVEQTVITLFRRKCLTVQHYSPAFKTKAKPWQQIIRKKPSVVCLKGIEWERDTAVLQWHGSQRGRRCLHHGWGRYSLPPPDE